MRILDVDQVAADAAASLTPHLIEGEEILAAFSSATGLILFTGRRILIVQREHLLEEKVETSSYPYRELRHFAITEGTSESSRSVLRIWLGTEPQPLHLRANLGTSLVPLQCLLAGKLA
jgi:hypothetical protein